MTKHLQIIFSTLSLCANAYLFIVWIVAFNMHAAQIDRLRFYQQYALVGIGVYRMSVLLAAGTLLSVYFALSLKTMPTYLKVSLCCLQSFFLLFYVWTLL